MICYQTWNLQNTCPIQKNGKEKVTKGKGMAIFGSAFFIRWKWRNGQAEEHNQQGYQVKEGEKRQNNPKGDAEKAKDLTVIQFPRKQHEKIYNSQRVAKTK